MLIDPKLSSWVNEHIVCQESARRLADGSIDYRHYDQQARRLRARAFARPLAAVAKGFRAMANLFGEKA
ncbi:hypothetical protein AAFN47_12250 [Hoeflea sp. CAU 1731]